MKIVNSIFIFLLLASCSPKSYPYEDLNTLAGLSIEELFESSRFGSLLDYEFDHIKKYCNCVNSENNFSFKVLDIQSARNINEADKDYLKLLHNERSQLYLLYSEKNHFIEIFYTERNPRETFFFGKKVRIQLSEQSRVEKVDVPLLN